MRIFFGRTNLKLIENQERLSGSPGVCSYFCVFNAVSLFLTKLLFCVDDGVVLWLKIKKSYYLLLLKKF